MKHFPFPVRLAAGLAASTADTVRDLPKHLTELPVTVASQVLQTSMRVQQHVTELAIKGDDALAAFRGVEDEPNWATFDEDDDPSPAAAGAWAGSSAPGAAATFDDPWDAESQALGEEHEDGEFDSADTGGIGTDGVGTGTPSANSFASTRNDAAASDPVAADGPPTALGEPAANAAAGNNAAGTTSGKAASGTAAGSTSGKTATGGGSASSGPAGVSDYDALSLPELRSRLRSFSADELEQLLEYERDNENRPSFTGMLTRRIANVRASAQDGDTDTEATDENSTS